jgi:small subunit ribosomal protein S20
MPVTVSAEKKVRKDKKRTSQNKKRLMDVKKFIKEAKKKPTKESIIKAQSAIDKLSKVHVIHKNKASRMKSQIAKLFKKKDNKTKANAV